MALADDYHELVEKSRGEISERKPLKFHAEMWGYDYSTNPPTPFRRTSNYPSRRVSPTSFNALLMRSGTRAENYSRRSILDSEGRLLPWYLEYLDRFREPLFTSDTKDSTLRFIWVRASENPICVTVNFSRSGSSIYGREILGVKPLHEKRIEKLTKAQVNSLNKKIDNPDLWQAIPFENPSEHTPKDPVTIWVLEHWDGKAYHHVERQSPKSGPVRDLALELLSLTELNPFGN